MAHGQFGAISGDWADSSHDYGTIAVSFYSGLWYVFTYAVMIVEDACKPCKLIFRYRFPPGHTMGGTTFAL